MARHARTYTPEPESAVAYGRLYGRYCRLDDLLLPWYAGGDGLEPGLESTGAHPDNGSNRA